ncbi:MAG: hypothetical protein K2N34_07145, partial [Lachnospiraceae bacterium]|nr:hypothetical protein [Lachnospiraceae bacterium]
RCEYESGLRGVHFRQQGFCFEYYSRVQRQGHQTTMILIVIIRLFSINMTGNYMKKNITHYIAIIPKYGRKYN